MESGDLMMSTKVSLDIRLVLAELKLSMKQFEEANVLKTERCSLKEMPFMDSFELLSESYDREMHVDRYSQ
jgi:hypothetical protein